MRASPAELVQAIASGETGAMRELYSQFADALFRFALLGLGDRDAAEDVVQETMLAAWRGVGGFRGESSVRSWFFGICRNQVALELRRRGHAPEPVPPDEDAPAPEPSVSRLEIEEAMGMLDVEQRQLLHLVYVEGLPQREVADVLGVPVGTVKSRLFSARERLRSLLGEDEP